MGNPKNTPIDRVRGTVPKDDPNVGAKETKDQKPDSRNNSKK